jgi:hypothetical protein
MILSKPLALGSSVSPLLSSMMASNLVTMILLSLFTLLLYVDDMIITGDDSQSIAFVKQCLSETFLMSDLGSLRYFLGLEVTSTSDGIFLSQEKYTQDLFSRAALTDHRTIDTPMELGVHLLLIPLTIVSLSGALSILGSPILIFLTMFIS